MQSNLDPQAWVKQLELTAPIKSIMGFVDELSANYDRRIANLKAEYKADLEEVIACYKQEKQAMENMIQSKISEILAQELRLEEIQKEFIALQQVYNIEKTEHKISKDALSVARAAIEKLSAELKTEQELIAIAHERIRVANEQLKFELADIDPVDEKKSTFFRTYDFIMQIFRKSESKVDEQSKADVM